MDAIDRLRRNPRGDGLGGVLRDYERDGREIQFAILEELTLLRKAVESLSMILIAGHITYDAPDASELAAAVRAGHERLLEAVKEAK